MNTYGIVLLGSIVVEALRPCDDTLVYFTVVRQYEPVWDFKRKTCPVIGLPV